MLKTILVIAAIAGIAQGTFVHNVAMQTEQKLSALLMRSTEQMTVNPTSSVACFNEYMPKLNNLTSEYERSYNLCLLISDERLAALEYEMNTSRNYLTNIASSTCKAYTDCNNSNMAIDFFNCYAGVANNATKTSFEIETTSLKNVGYITHTYENVRYDRESCCDAASVKYIAESTATYAALEECLAQVSKVP